MLLPVRQFVGRCRSVVATATTTTTTTTTNAGCSVRPSSFSCLSLQRLCTSSSSHAAQAVDGTATATGSTSYDLSHAAAPIGSLFGPLPGRGDAQWRALQLSEQQVAQYRKDGFISNVDVLTEQQVDALLDEYAAYLDPAAPHPKQDLLYEFHSNETGDPSAVLMHALGHWRASPGFHDLVWLPAVTAVTSQLLLPADGGDGPGHQAVRFWHDQLFGKPPHHGGCVAWHQDYSYWTATSPMNHMTVHIALDDQTQDNGGLMFVPGSHTWHRDGAPLPITSRHFDDMDSIHEILTPEEEAAWRVVPAGLKKGQASFHHPLLVHGSMGNNSAAPRRAAVLNYFADGTCCNHDGMILENTEAIPRGEPMRGRFFPLVFDPTWLPAS